MGKGPERQGSREAAKGQKPAFVRKPARVNKDSQAGEAEAALHPSWAAKLQKKETAAFEGKRMVFDD